MGGIDVTTSEKYVNQKHLLQYSLREQLVHGMRVSNLACGLAKELGLPEDYCYDMAVAGMLHDIGKERVSNALDEDAERLIVEEIHYVRLHSQASYEILKQRGYFRRFCITMKTWMAAVTRKICPVRQFRWGQGSSGCAMFMRH